MVDHASKLMKRISDRQKRRVRYFYRRVSTTSVFSDPKPRFSLLENDDERIAVLNSEVWPRTKQDHDFWTWHFLLTDPRFGFPYPVDRAALIALMEQLPANSREEAAYSFVLAARWRLARSLEARGRSKDDARREIAELRRRFGDILPARDALSPSSHQYLADHQGDRPRSLTEVALDAVEAALLHDPALQQLPAEGAFAGRRGQPWERQFSLDVRAILNAALGRPASWNETVSFHNKCCDALPIPTVEEDALKKRLSARQGKQLSKLT
jgi:hypothetical protein